MTLWIIIGLLLVGGALVTWVCVDLDRANKKLRAANERLEKLVDDFARDYYYISDRHYDKCKENHDYSVAINKIYDLIAPHQSRVDYVCDRTKCEECNVTACNHTCDISHAVNFEILGEYYIEKDGTEEEPSDDVMDSVVASDGYFNIVDEKENNNDQN